MLPHSLNWGLSMDGFCMDTCRLWAKVEQFILPIDAYSVWGNRVVPLLTYIPKQPRGRTASREPRCVALLYGC